MLIFLPSTILSSALRNSIRLCPLVRHSNNSINLTAVNHFLGFSLSLSLSYFLSSFFSAWNASYYCQILLQAQFQEAVEFGELLQWVNGFNSPSIVGIHCILVFSASSNLGGGFLVWRAAVCLWVKWLLFTFCGLSIVVDLFWKTLF